jgi:hypothetical protein
LNLPQPDSPSCHASAFRVTLGLVALIGGLLGLAGLYFVPIPPGNREPLLLALGLVLGWGSTVIGYEFGSSPAGRRAADAGIRLQPDAPPPR